MTQEQQAAIVGALQSKVAEELEKKGFTTGDKVKEIAQKAIESTITEVKANFVSKDDYEQVKAASLKQGEEITRLKLIGDNGKPMTFKALFERVRNEENKANLPGDNNQYEKSQMPFNEWVKQKNWNNHFYIDLKGITFEPTRNQHNTEYDNTITQLPQKRSGIMSAITKGRSNKPFIEWMEKQSEDGNAIFDVCKVGLPITCGQLKPKKDGWKYVQNYSKAEKFPVYIPICEEQLTDYDWLQSEIELELNAELDAYVGSFFRNLLLAVAPPFQLTMLNNVDVPNLADAIKAACSQPHKFGYETTHILINSTDYTNMQLLKDSCGRPLIEGLDCGAEAMICCAKVVIDDCIPEGSFVLGDFSKINYREVWSRFLRIGYGDGDFLSNRISLMMEERFHGYIKQNERLAFVADTFENVIAAFGATTGGTPLSLTINTHVISVSNQYVTGIDYTGTQTDTEIMAVFVDSTGVVTHVDSAQANVSAISGFVYNTQVEILNGGAYNGELFVYTVNPAANTPVLSVGDNISTIDPAWNLQGTALVVNS